MPNDPIRWLQFSAKGIVDGLLYLTGEGVNFLYDNLESLAVRVFNQEQYHEESNGAFPGAARTTTSTSYTDWPSGGDVLTLNFTKRLDATYSDLIVEFRGSAYSSTVGGPVDWAVQVNGTDYFIARHFFNASVSAGNAAHLHVGGQTGRITGLAPGVYTVKLRVKVPAGPFTLNVDTNDTNFLNVREIQK